MEFKAISDELTIEEFNAIVSMYRHFKTIKKPLRINEQVLGDYGTYNFNMDGVTFVDNGILITNETIQAEPSVLLTDNQFTHSTYTLTLQVLHNTSLNIIDDDVKDFKVVETLDLELIPDTEIKIPVDELQQGYIISFDSFIEIKHDKTIMQGEIPEPTIIDDIVLTSDKDILSYVDRDVANLSAQLMMEGEPASVSGETVTFEVRKSSDDSLIETLSGTTNASGVASVSYTSKGAGDIYIKGICMNVSKRYGVQDKWYYNHNDNTVFSSTVNKNGDYLSVSSNKDSILFTTPIQLPSEFKISYILQKWGSSGNWSYMSIGEEWNINLDCGKIQASRGYIRNRQTGEHFYFNESLSNYTDYVVTITYQNGTVTLSYDNRSVSEDTHLFNLNYLIGIGLAANTKIKDIIIEKL